MKFEPQKEHRWLEKLVGDWDYEHASSMEPGKTGEMVRGTERVRSLGGAWVVCEAQVEMPGLGTMWSIMTLGYDPMKTKFVGSFVVSVTAHFWVYEGSLDAKGETLTLDAEGPSFAMGGTLAQYKDRITIIGADRRTLSSEVQGADGTWTQFMTVNYWRKK
jgi:hypothetical protein